ncbi:MAG: hypothetical protein J7L77_04765 [Clostridiales bacterium]|nr:hypothetical protein [Clostridiales bacterium]
MINKCKGFFSTRRPLKIAGMIIGGILVAGLMAFLFGWVLMLLWNWLMPTIFGLTTITYWQGFGIFFLAKLLFGFGGEHSSDNRKNKKKEPKEGTIKDEMGNGIKNGIRKEFEKEYEKEFKKDFNASYDDKYEDWWSNEGKIAFDNYMKNNPKAEPKVES